VLNSGYFWSRVSCDLSPTEQVLSRAPDPGPAADVSQADQVPGHLSLEQHRPPAQTGNEIKAFLICFYFFKNHNSSSIFLSFWFSTKFPRQIKQL